MKNQKATTLFLLITTLFFAHLVNAQQPYESPKLSNSNSWTMIMLPDTQSYVKFGRNHGILELITAWVDENINPLNIKMVVCTGDLVEQNNIIVADSINGNQSSRNQWLAVSRAFSRLDGKVPYILAAGNHDFGYKNIEHRSTQYNTFFPSHKNQANIPLLQAAGKNKTGQPSVENAAYEFIAPNKRKFLFLNLEFAPRDTILQWAKHITDQKKYQNHTVAVLTHSYLNADNEHISDENYPIKNGNYGKAIFDKLVKPSNNIQLVLSGHIGAPNNPRQHVGFRTDTNAAGKKIQQMVFNAQALGGGWQGNGGDGWLRILEFLPDGKTVKVKTFSPLFAISPTTQQFAWRKAPYDEFSFTLD